MIDFLLDFALYSLIFFCVTFCYYIIVMELNKHFGLVWWVKALGFVFLVFFDAPLNILVVSVWFREWPQEWLVTHRLKRWRKEYEHRNFNELHEKAKKKLLFAVYICDEHLDRYDSFTGDHC